MTTTNELANQMRSALGNGLRYDPVTTTGRTLLEEAIASIQAEAFRAGLDEAVRVADGWVHNLEVNSSSQQLAGMIRDDIMASRDNTPNKF